jgi:elongation factor P
VTAGLFTMMKIAQELRAGQVIELDGQAWIVLKAEFNKSGRNASVMKMKLKNLLSGSTQEPVFKADDKIEQIVLERKEVTYSYFADPLYVFMDTEYNQIEVEKENLGDTFNFIVDGMQEVCEAVFYQGKAISVELPNYVIRKIHYTEPAARGDTSGKVTKLATLENGYEFKIPSFVDIGEDVEIDTRTGEFRSRAK